MSERGAFFLIKKMKHFVKAIDYLRSQENFIIDKWELQDIVDDDSHADVRFYERLLRDNTRHWDVTLEKGKAYMFVFMRNSAGYPESIDLVKLEEDDDKMFKKSWIYTPS